MRSYLIFILALALFLSNSGRTPKAFAYSNKIQVTATVLEHLTYKKEGEATLAQTNYDKGLFIINENSNLTVVIARY